MKKIFISFLLYGITIQFFAQNTTENNFVLVIHGGAGTIKFDPKNPNKQKVYEIELEKALSLGYDTLSKNATALDAIEVVIKYLEDSPLFNAGKGAVFTNSGTNELDASIMDGSNLKAGSVAGVKTIKNPISCARAVMEKSQHVMLSGKGAEEFAKLNNLQIVSPKYFYTNERWKSLQKVLEAEKKLKTTGKYTIKENNYWLAQNKTIQSKYGTVGAVALDKYGNLAAGTSTGGMTNKRFGRIGDAPIIGAGTYANNNTCAISCTGWGEYFIRLVMAKSVSDIMEYKNTSIDEAAKFMIHTKLQNMGADGGLIGVDKLGNITMQFNSEGMYRGYIKSNGQKYIAIFKDKD